MGTAFSAALFMSIIAKSLFNLVAEVKMPLDLWTTIDAVSSILNILAFNIIGKAKPEDIIDYQRKASLDYYVIAVLILSWIRFFSYFLVI